MMKNLKIKLFSFIALFISVTFLSCSNDNETIQNNSSNKNVETFLKSFYNQDFQLGKSVETTSKGALSHLSKTTEFENFIVTEVFVGEDTRARGYIITDKNTENLVYFLDVDRIEYKITAVELDINETKLFHDINELDEYLSTDGFDLIKIVEDPEFELPEDGTVSFRVRYSYGAPFTGNDGNCYQGVYQATYFLGIRFTKVTVVQNENGSKAYVPCGTSYQP